MKKCRSYFSKDGIELNFGRVPIGGCDFSTRTYTYDDDHEGDSNLSNFNLTSEDFDYKVGARASLFGETLSLSDAGPRESRTGAARCSQMRNSWVYLIYFS
jgi:Glycosyl hydrolase family 30 TIM-barrel domain